MNKILFYGNLCNIGYNFAKAINDYGTLDIHAEFLISCRDMENINTSNPIWEDVEVQNRPPNWVVILKEKKIRGKGLLRAAYSMIYNYRNCKAELSQKDVIFSSTLMNIWAMLCAKKYVAMTTGADISELAHEKNLLGRLYLRSLKKANRVGILNTNHVDYMKRLKLQNYQFIPFAIDTAKYENKNVIKKTDKITILHSSGLDWIEADIRPNNVKKNDIFFKGFSKFITNVDNEIAQKIELIILEFGKDIEETKALNLELGISERVTYLPKCTKNELIKLYNRADIVVDQFAVGAFGLNALEAMASQCAVLTYLEEANMLECYGNLPPILNCKTEDEVFQRLSELTFHDFGSLDKMKEDAKKWVVEHHDYKNVVPTIVDIINNI